MDVEVEKSRDRGLGKNGIFVWGVALGLHHSL